MIDLSEAKAQGVAPWQEMTVDLDTVKVFADAYPVTPGHRLFVPRTQELDAIVECFRQAYKYGEIMVRNGACDGFNVGINYGKAAGQTVMYPHVHCIPRRTGDTDDPTGGVRNVIPGKGNYKNSKSVPIPDH